MTEDVTQTLIIGGGLSGLALADILHRAGEDFTVVERRERLGGRIFSATCDGAAFDLGPAWFWPGQPRMAALAARAGAHVFEQYATGNMRFETAQGTVQEGAGYGSMKGSLRVSGGLNSLVQHLADALPAHAVIMGQTVVKLSQNAQDITATLSEGKTITARRVVLAVPPRIADQIIFSPALPAAAHSALQSAPTWMAGQAKAVATYDAPFWRHAGLSGDAMSQRGPMFEIHDASPDAEGPYALFGFIGIPASHRQDAEALKAAVTAQFARLFGPDAPAPRNVFVKDWAFDPATATKHDHLGPSHHPRSGLPAQLQGLWNGSLVFSGTETAPEFGGFLEGALEAAEIASAHLLPTARRA